MRPSFWRRIPGNWSYLLRIFVRRPEDDVDAELRFHFDERIAELTAQGTSRELARAKATEEFGDVDRVRERLHDIDRRLAQRRRRADWWEGATQDLRYVLRGLARSPGFTVMVVITLALGIGANAAIFSVLDRLFVQAPVGVRHPEEIRRLYQDLAMPEGRTMRANFSYAELRDLRAALPTGITFAAHVEGTVRLGRGADAEKVMAVWVLGDHFGVLGVRPLIGRFFTAEESSVETFAPVAVISERLWKERFGGTPAALGQPLDLGAHRFTVIGVTPPGFRGVDIDVADVWLPEGTHTSWTDRKPNWYDEHLWTGAMRVLTRVARPAEARAFEAIAALSLKHTGWLLDSTAKVQLGSVMEASLLSKDNDSGVGIAARLAGVTLIVLLIACANVANLLLARGLQRRRELAVRLALGVSRRRLVLQLLTESTALALMAGMVALLVTIWSAGALRAALLPNTAWGESVLSMRIGAMVMVSALVTGVAAGLVPALQVSNPDLATALKEGGRSGSVLRSRTRATLVVVQAAFSVVLLTGAGVFLRSLDNIHGVDIGYDANRLIYAQVTSDDDESHRDELGVALPVVLQRVRQMAGVEQAALIEYPPMWGYVMMELHFPGRDSVPKLNDQVPLANPVTPTFFGVSGMKLHTGRDFTDSDRQGAALVVVVNETMARAVWPGESALGKCFIVGNPEDPCREIVGVVSDAHSMKIVERPTMQFYLPLAQSPWKATSLMIRVDPRRANAVAKDTKTILAASLGRWAMPTVRRMDEILARELRPYRLGASLFSAAGLLALLVAAVGIYSSIAYSISQRMYEMGIRIALGARASQILRLIIGEGLRVVLLGILIGTVITLAVGRLVASFLFGTTPHDPAVLAAVVILPVSVAAIAAVVPALRATRSDPANALRAE
jgi:predicted permease